MVSSHNIHQQAPLVPDPRPEVHSVGPASAQQDYIWLQTTVAPVAWQACVVVDLPSPVDILVLERSLYTLVNMHEILRATFNVVGGQLNQVIHSPAEVTLSVTDISDAHDDLSRVIDEIVGQPYVVSQLPLFRAHLVLLPDDRGRLVVCAHRLICSQSSLSQAIIPTWASLYATSTNQLRASQVETVEETTLQYATFTERQWNTFVSAAGSAALAYWEQQLNGAPYPLDLPHDYPRPVEPTSSSFIERRLPWSLAQTDVEAIAALSQRIDVAPEALWMAALAVFVARHTGHDELLLGYVSPAPLDGEPAIGPCEQTRALRADLSGSLTFLDLARRMQVVWQGADAHREVTFEYVMQKRQSRVEMNRMSLVQVALRLEPAPAVLAADWRMLPGPTDMARTPLDLVVVVGNRNMNQSADFAPSGEGYLAYNADCFDARMVAWMARRWETLLSGIALDPSQSVMRLPLISEMERRDLLERNSAAASPAPMDVCLHQLVESQVARTSDACAVMVGEQRLTYSEMNARANQLARHLRGHGVGPNTLVGLCAERSLEMVVGILGILKAGGAYVVLDPEYPQDRLQFMLSDSSAPVVVMQKRLRDALPPHAGKVVYLDADWPDIAAESTENLNSSAGPDDLAYIIYTSGSTGRPKGVMVRHSNVVNSTYARLLYYTEPVTAYLMLYSFAFDGSVGGFFSTLCRGGALVLPEPGEEHDPSALARLIALRRVSHVDTVTTLYGLLLQSARAEQMATVRTVIIGAEACPSELPARHYTIAPQATLYNEYGPTETTVWSTVYAIPSHERGTDVPIGRPIANTRLYVLDGANELAPIGVVGQLSIGGAGVTQGYLNRPDLTEARFVHDPFCERPDQMMYQTGDLVRYLRDGNLQFVGRVDTQVKLHGFRIELSEIEAALSELPDILSAVVTVREDTPGEQRLVAYIIPSERQAPSYQEVRQRLRQRMPSYMIPTALVALDAFPLSPNGKLDRSALPKPLKDVNVESSMYVAPEYMIHYQMVAVWESLLDTRPIGITDNFFDLGGNSFLAARLVASIKQTWHIELPLKTLFVGPTISEIAAYLIHAQVQQSSESGDEGEVVSEVVRAPVVAIQAIQPGVERLPFFYLHAEWRGGAFYCIPLARALGPEQPFYVLEPYRFDGQAAPPSFQEMAAAHRAALQSVQPKGPYYLGGFCAGALIAYEIARQLSAAGERVELLMMVNLRDVDRQPRWARSVLQGVGRLIRLAPATQLDAFLTLRHLEWNVRMTVLGKKQLIVPWASKQEMRTRWAHIFDWVAAGYRLGGYSGAVTLLWSSDEPEESKQQWHDAMANNAVTTYTLPGNDMTCRTTHLSDFANIVRICLNEARATGV